ncbi:hypothetical protein D0024_24730 [Salmonella enterica]|nr:hypothetical protein [Salmonella enterica]
MVEIKPDGTPVYFGRTCRKSGCNCKEHLAINAYGAKAGKCYACAVAARSEKGATLQISRLRQQVKKACNQFVIQSIEQAGTVDVAPENLSEYYLVRALIEERDRLNLIAEAGVVWEIGHKFPASGGGTEYRGKATVNNLALIRKELNRSIGDNLPLNWSVNQVVWVGDAFTLEISNAEAATAWRNRMGWDSATSDEKSQQKARETAENDKHKAELTNLAKCIVKIPGMAISAGDEWAALVAKVERRIEAIDRKQRAIIKNALRRGESIYQAGGLTEEALHGLNARYRIIYNTLNQLVDVINKIDAGFNNDPFDEMSDAAERNISYCRFLSETALIKRAFLMWAEDCFRNPTRSVQGFTHPYLDQVPQAKVWGTKQGEDGRLWFCGWLVKKDEEPVEIPPEHAARWVSMERLAFIESETNRKDAVRQQFHKLITEARHWCEAGIALSVDAEIDTSNFYDEADAEQHTQVTRQIMLEDAQRRFERLDRIREKLNSWWRMSAKLSAQDVEKEAPNYVAMFADYQTEPRAGSVNAWRYTTLIKEQTEEGF